MPRLGGMYGPDVTELPVLGLDVVEVSPPYDAAEITAFLANRVVLEVLAGIAFRRRGGTWASIPKTLLEGRAPSSP
jgi:Arginase family